MNNDDILQQAKFIFGEQGFEQFDDIYWLAFARAVSNVDKRVLELALQQMSLALDALVTECTDTDGNPKGPSKQSIMRARGLLPPYCGMALSKKAPDKHQQEISR